MNDAGTRYWLKNYILFIKETIAMWKVDVEKRREYPVQIKGLASEKLLYLDESGIDINIRKERGWGKKLS